jgi:hypothetical protein
MGRRPKKFGKRKYKDNRDWVKTNEQYVIRGTFYLDLSFKDKWDKELEKMNKGKKGGQYKFPDSFVFWLAVWHQLVDYRGLEGISRKLQQLGFIPYFEDYTTAWYRIHNFKPKIKLPSFKKLNISTDGTGLRNRNNGKYLEFKYGKKGRDRYIVVTITVDVRHKKLLGIEAHVEGQGPTEPEVGIKHGKELIEEGYDIDKFNGDGKYDTNDTFDFWGKNRTRIAVPIRKGAKIRLTKSKYRKREIRKWRKWGYKKWRKQRQYGDRLAAEGENSGTKRVFGENLSSKKDDSACSEAIQKFVFYDFLKDYGNGIR